MVRNEKRFSRQAAEEVRILELLKRQDRRAAAIFRNHVCIVFELLSMNLYELVRKKSLPGIFAAAGAQIIHCDLKPENILLKCPGRSGVKVIDFGSSCDEHQRVYTYIQSSLLPGGPSGFILGGKYGLPIRHVELRLHPGELLTGQFVLPATRCSPARTKDTSWPASMELCGTPPQALLDACRRTKVFFSSRGLPRYSSVDAGPDGSPQLKGAGRGAANSAGPPGSRDLPTALKGTGAARDSRCSSTSCAALTTREALRATTGLKRRLPRPPVPAGAAAAIAAEQRGCSCQSDCAAGLGWLSFPFTNLMARHSLI
uniref:Protein kinase domain-containing protein n=1 Tax=Macrostomum lignano TaxID=282301 RepID=A0A1I8F8H7_9PLAT